MCGTNKDCGCNAAEKAQHKLDHPEEYAVTAVVAGEENASHENRDTATTVDESITPDALVADATDPATDLPSQWHAVLTVEGLRTTDHRAIALNALTWRELPLSIFAQFDNAGHDGAAIVGQITSISRDDTTGQILGEGTFDLTLDAGQQAALMCKNQTLRWNSIDLEVLESQYVEVSTNPGGGDILDMLFGDDDEVVEDWYQEVTAGRIMGTTMVALPAFPQAVIAPIDVTLDVPMPMGVAPTVAQGLMASAVDVPTTPPASWFRNPELTEPTSLTITDDGKIFGHLALWDQCHTGFQDVCIVPPHSEQDYAYFQTGKVACEGGEQVRVGQITFDTGHAGSTLDWRATASHYDNTGSVAADVTVGEDDLGIWFAGALRPGLTEDNLRAVRASALSGDWRKIGGGLELMAALAVNVPGFPIVASLAPSLVAAGIKQYEQVSLITAGLRPRSPMIEMARQIAEIKKAIKPLMGLSVERLAARVNATPKVIVSIDELRDRVNLGGTPKTSTPADRRLKENKKKAKMPEMAAAQ